MLIDYHVHNRFSPDSEESTRKIVLKAQELGLKEICLTNHPELHDKKTGGSHFEIDEALERFRRIQADISEVQKEYPEIKIRFGVELEYAEDRMDALAEFVRKTDFDFILGSVHIVRGIIISSHHFADELYANTDEKTAYTAYFQDMMKLVEWGHLDAVAHFDINKKFGVRFYGPFRPEKYRDQIMPILQRMKEKGIGIELNAKCMKSKCRELFPHPLILDWAVETGIKNFTIGSDAHKAKNVGQDFAEVETLAKKAGIKNLSIYKKRKPFSIVF